MRDFAKPRKVNYKYYKDIVTDVDVAVEKKLISLIHKKFPDHSILSEEIGLIERNKEYLWVIDPLDGTVNYTAGIPLFSVSICLVRRGKPYSGVVYAPYLKEYFYGEKGKGAFLNNRKIKPSTTSDLSQAVIHVAMSAHYSPELIEKNWKLLNKLSHRVRGLRMLDSGALTSCYVACGRLDGKFSIKTDPFGNAASAVIIEEAGGRVTDFKGGSWNVKMKDMLCSNQRLYKKLKGFVS